MEHNSTNKALPLTRVTNATEIAIPVNGMILYDNSSSCIKTYENSAWYASLSN